MKKSAVFPLVGFLLLALASALAQGPPLFPYPSYVTYGAQSETINPWTFMVYTHSPLNSLLASAIKRYTTHGGPMFPFTNTVGTTTIANLAITVTSPSDSLQLGVDESYTLTLSTEACNLAATTVFGAMRGLETFAQLVVWNETTNMYDIGYLPITVKDTPRFQWRGLMIDTARHFLTVDTIESAIDAISYSKMNTLHWHVVDAESFPIESDAYPALALGAYSAKAVYPSSVLRDIVAYGMQRGVRVVIELDVPGHTASWAKGYSNLTAKCPTYSHNINNIPLDPSNPFVFELLEGLLGEMSDVFPDDYMHMGGDEVIFDCWFDDPAIVAWMNASGFTNGADVEQYFETRLARILSKNNKTLVCWQELFNNGVTLNADTVVEVWEDVATLQEVINGGYRALVAFPYYLNKQVPKPGSLHYQWGDTWQDFHDSDPYDGITGSNLHNIIGGEAIMFGEQVDSSNFEGRVWPRAAAVAERLWSFQTITNLTDATMRLIAFRCRLAQRGIAAGPIAPDYCPTPDTIYK